MLKVKDVTVQFGGVRAIEDLSFDVLQGDFLGLIGPNGAGKTTAMRSITGVVVPQKGQIQLQNHELLGKPSYARIRMGLGLSQQIVKPFRSMSVWDNVIFAAGFNHTQHPVRSLFSLSRKAEKILASKFLSLVGISDVADARPDDLPLGYLKRLELARAIALKPKLLLLDEPLAGLNQMEATKLADVLVRLNKEGQTIILIEHNLSEVIRICKRIVVMDNGRKLAEGDPKEVMNNPAVRTAYLG